MKTVLFCGGLGMRMRDMPEPLPKPMATIGYRPILWHLMKYYAHYGHRDFVLCLGYRADLIKQYFVNYSEYITNDFVLSDGGRQTELLSKDIQDWRITFLDTGLSRNIGQRLLMARRFVQDEEIFLANYADGLTDLPLDQAVNFFRRSGKVACFLAVNPTASFHIAATKPDGTVTAIEHIGKSGYRINGGYFLFRREIFNYLHEGEELVEAPFRRLIAEEQLLAYCYDGFWACMDTFKEKQHLEDLLARDQAPWEVWRGHDTDRSLCAAS
ncbi:MAG TPA: sugar phosphate nucleotidyltransferase [Opitutus sp.]|nr:sugar phosphate nucleotidyltransferase [Opitutus sp.]